MSFLQFLKGNLHERDKCNDFVYKKQISFHLFPIINGSISIRSSKITCPSLSFQTLKMRLNNIINKLHQYCHFSNEALNNTSSLHCAPF